jgi:hypothetical protein
VKIGASDSGVLPDPGTSEADVQGRFSALRQQHDPGKPATAQIRSVAMPLVQEKIAALRSQ